MSLRRSRKEACGEAKDPKTLPSRLAELANSEDKEIRREVAKNPATPLETLLVLAQESPQEFLANRALPLLFLETPNLLHGLTKDAAKALLESKAVPSFALHSLAHYPDSHVRKLVAEHPNTPQTLLKTLANDEDEDVRRGVAENPNTPVTCLETLAHDKEVDVRTQVAEHPNTPISCLELLTNDRHEFVRRGAAWNQNTPHACLETLANDRNPDVRWNVAWNQNTPLPCLETLANDKDKNVCENAEEELQRRRREAGKKNSHVEETGRHDVLKVTSSEVGVRNDTKT